MDNGKCCRPDIDAPGRGRSDSFRPTRSVFDDHQLPPVVRPLHPGTSTIKMRHAQPSPWSLQLDTHTPHPPRPRLLPCWLYMPSSLLHIHMRRACAGTLPLPMLIGARVPDVLQSKTPTARPTTPRRACEVGGVTCCERCCERFCRPVVITKTRLQNWMPLPSSVFEWVLAIRSPIALFSDLRTLAALAFRSLEAAALVSRSCVSRTISVR